MERNESSMREGGAFITAHWGSFFRCPDICLFVVLEMPEEAQQDRALVRQREQSIDWLIECSTSTAPALGGLNTTSSTIHGATHQSPHLPTFWGMGNQPGGTAKCMTKSHFGDLAIPVYVNQHMMDSRLSPIFEAASKAKKVPGVAAIALDKSGDVLFRGAYGSTNLDDPTAPSLTSKTPMMIWSCTKLVTTVAALQLVEQGKLHLDDLVEKHVPSITKIQVLEGFTPEGEPILRAPKTKATVLMLMTHTAGFTYDFINNNTLTWRKHVRQGESKPLPMGSLQNYESPLAFDPGTKYEYGVNIDWLGFVVEAVSGVPLNEYVEEHILKPLGMADSGSHVKEGVSPMVIHIRGEDGGLTAVPAISYPTTPERFGGGEYLYASLDDYAAFLLTILNKGTHPVSKVEILRKETVDEYLFQDQVHKICSNAGVGVFTTANPVVTSEGEFLPGLEKGWSAALMLNLEGSPKGRNAGSGQWAGLGNLYYWVDPEAGRLGLIMSGIVPFMDKEVLCLFDEFERAVYGHDSAAESGGKGGNFAVAPLPWHAS